MTDPVAGMRAVWAAALMTMAAVVILCLAAHSESRAVTSLVQLRQRKQMLWGGFLPPSISGAMGSDTHWERDSHEHIPLNVRGKGLVTTGDYVDGRKTTAGLQTNCLPGVLRSDCSPAQEDGAWSTAAAEYLDDHTGSAHSHTMERLQANVDRAFKAKDEYLDACLKDWRNCNKPAAEVTGYDDSIDEENDDATFGIHRRFSAKPSLKYSGVAPPDQYSEYSPMMDDGPWNDVKRPTGHHADKSGLVSSAYWTSNDPPGHVY